MRIAKKIDKACTLIIWIELHFLALLFGWQLGKALGL